VLLAVAALEVWIFTRTDCPIANRYAPAIEKLYQEYSARGVAFKLIYPEPGVTAANVEKHRTEYRLTVPFEIDSKQLLVKQAGVQVTPEAAVFSDGKLIYRGRIDDRQAALNFARQGTVTQDLAITLDSILTGHRPPKLRTTRAFGCAIEPPAK
jgi:hypothetical protein